MANEIADASVQEFANMLSVNVMGIFLVTRAMSAVMKQQEPVPVRSDMPERGTARGCIVNIGSASGLVATPKMTQYTASKHAVVGVTKNAGEEEGFLTPVPDADKADLRLCSQLWIMPHSAYVLTASVRRGSTPPW